MQGGFFTDLMIRYAIRCPHVFFECKNYSKVVANPEIDQLIGRFSPRRGKLGILVCRQVADRDALEQRCRNAMNSEQGHVLFLEDLDLTALIRLRADGDFQGIADYIDDKMKRLVM